MPTRNLPLAPLLAAFFATASITKAQDEAYSSNSIFSSQIGTITINGFPYVEDDGTGDGSISRTNLLGHCILQGENVIRAELHDQTDDASGHDLPGAMKLRLEYGSREESERLVAFEITRETKIDEDGKVLESINVVAENGFDAQSGGVIGAGDASSFVFNAASKSFQYSHAGGDTHVVEITFDVADSPLTTLPWQGAQIVPDAADRAAITALVGSIRDALAAENAAAVQALISEKTARLAIALGQSEAEIESQIAQFWTLFFDDPEFSFDPIDATGWQFETFEGFNLVRVRQADGSPPITGSSPEKAFSLPVFVSKIGGTWTIVD